MKRHGLEIQVSSSKVRSRLIMAIMLMTFSFVGMTHAKTRVVCSTSDLAYLAGEIGGEHVDVSYIAQPKRDIHYVDVRPSFMMKVGKADVVFRVGLDLDLWMDQLVNGSRNSQLILMDCSRDIQPLEVPTSKADARYGDVHQRGNPHYWLTPDNLEPLSNVIVDGLSKADPDHAELFEVNRRSMIEEITEGMKKLRPKLDSLKGVEVIFYHNSWPYFTQFTGLITAGFIEPYPGVPPSPAQLQKTAKLARARNIKVICSEVYFDKRPAEKVASSSNTNAKVVTLYPSIGGREEGESYLDWFEGNIESVLEAIR